MPSVLALIDRGRDQVGSYAELARRIGVKPQRVNDWRHSIRVPTPEQVADLANLAGCTCEEAREFAALVVANNPKNAERRESLMRAFFGGRALGVAFALTLASNSDGLSAALRQLTLYTLSCVTMLTTPEFSRRRSAGTKC